jgi:recombination protein RecA
MPSLIKRIPKQQEIDKAVEEIETTSAKPAQSKTPLDYNRVVSTGSTLLDLAISGNRVRGGGIPAGIMVEIYGPSGAGKTALLVEAGANAQFKGGHVRVNDPEARLDKEYAELYGLTLDNEFNDYDRPNTVEEMFKNIENWEVPKDQVSVFLGDSLAALSTDEELGEKGDKMGMKRAKDFSEGLRKTCRIISTNDKLIMFSNQVRDSVESTGFGPKENTTGGRAIGFYCSLRMRVAPAFPSSKIKKEISLKDGQEVAKDDKKGKLTKVIGIKSTVTVVKSTVDDPYREAPVNIIFGYGIDDVRGNLEYIKEMRKLTKYPTIDKDWQSLEKAIEYIEAKQYQPQLREQVIDLWEEIEARFKQTRTPKIRW